MDIIGRETLENMLKEYTGTVILVSHDRYFVNKVADRLLVFEKGKAVPYSFRYDEYEEKLQAGTLPLQNDNSDKDDSKAVSDNVSKNNGFPNKTDNKSARDDYLSLKERSKREKRAKKLEELIEEYDEKIAVLDEKLNNPDISSDYQELSKLQEEKEKLEKEQEELSEEWLQLADQDI